MIKLFNRNKININSIVIPDFGWNLEDNQKHIKEWINPDETLALTLNFFDIAPDLPTIKNIDVIRNFYRELISQNNGGLVQVDFITLKEIPAIKTIFKIPQDPHGMTYLASITIPFDKCSFVIKLQAPELGTTGIRDTVIADKLMKENKISLDEEKVVGWFEDPYDKNFSKGSLMNKSELIEYDELFPEHPLSIVRNLLGKIESSIDFNKEILKTKRFEK